MKILITANTAWNILNFRKPIVEALLAQGHEVSVLAPADDTVGVLRQMGCRFLDLTMQPKGLNPLEGLDLVRQFHRAYVACKPDVVLSYTIKCNIFGAFAARLYGTEFIPNVSGLGTAFLSGSTLQFVAEKLYRRAFQALPIVFFQNDEDRALFVSRGLLQDGQARTLPGSGIDLVHFAVAGYPPEAQPPTFLMIARLLRDKGVVEFADAARCMKAKVPEMRFQLLGAAGAANRSAISRDDLQGWLDEGVLEYLGTCQDVRPVIAKAHCVVLPSYREGAPRTLIEASAMGRPVIATDVPGCRSVVEAGRTGLMCAPKSAEDLARAMQRFAEMPLMRKLGMGRAGRAKMQREFDKYLVVNAYLDAIGAKAQPEGLIAVGTS